MSEAQDPPPENETMRQVRDALDDRRRRPMKELGIPDFREEEAAESDHRDDAWKHQRDDAARQKRRSEGGCRQGPLPVRSSCRVDGLWCDVPGVTPLTSMLSATSSPSRVTVAVLIGIV